MEERQRVKIVDYTGSKKVEQSKIEEKLREESVQIRLDSFIDQALIRRVEGIVREHDRGEGLRVRRGEPHDSEVAGGPKLVNLTFNLEEGPEGQGPQHRLHRQHGGLATARSSAR